MSPQGVLTYLGELLNALDFLVSLLVGLESFDSSRSDLSSASTESKMRSDCILLGDDHN